MRSTLKLYYKWGITFGEPYVIAEKTARTRIKAVSLLSVRLPMTSKSPSGQWSALSDLEKAGFVERAARWRERGGQSSNLYVLLDSS